MHFWLPARGVTPRKPVRRAYERDEAAVKKWLHEEYPAIHARAKRENAEIRWGDELGLRSDHQTGTIYSKRGVTPVIPGNRANLYSITLYSRSPTTEASRSWCSLNGSRRPS